jgi:predicted RNase H-like nuclease (RuvC/YqgF family)
LKENLEKKDGDIKSLESELKDAQAKLQALENEKKNLSEAKEKLVTELEKNAGVHAQLISKDEEINTLKTRLASSKVC